MTGPVEQSPAKIKLSDARNSLPAYSIRDFLQRSVVPFEWIDLQNDEAANDSKRRNGRATELSVHTSKALSSFHYRSTGIPQVSALTPLARITSIVARIPSA